MGSLINNKALGKNKASVSTNSTGLRTSLHKNSLRPRPTTKRLNRLRHGKQSNYIVEDVTMEDGTNTQEGGRGDKTAPAKSYTVGGLDMIIDAEHLELEGSALFAYAAALCIVERLIYVILIERLRKSQVAYTENSGVCDGDEEMADDNEKKPVKNKGRSRNSGASMGAVTSSIKSESAARRDTEDYNTGLRWAKGDCSEIVSDSAMVQVISLSESIQLVKNRVLLEISRRTSLWVLTKQVPDSHDIKELYSGNMNHISVMAMIELWRYATSEQNDLSPTVIVDKIII